MLPLAKPCAVLYSPLLLDLGALMITFIVAAWMSLAAPVANAEPYLMNDVGGTLHLPKGWEMGRWSDWDFKAAGPGNTILYKLWMTPYQTPINGETAKAYAAHYLEKVEKEGGSGASITTAEVKTIGGRTTAFVEIAFTSSGGKGSPGVFYGAAFAGEGQVVHSRVIASKRNAKAAKTGFMETLKTFELAKGPAETAGSDVATEAGFSATLPEGWRPPLEKERAGVLEITTKMWASGLESAECWVGILPPTVEDPDVLFACKKFWDGTPVDQYSFADIEGQWRDLFFGKAGAELPPGEQITVGERTGALFRPRDGDNPIRLMVAPFDGGLMAVWMRGSSVDAAGADTAMNGLAATVKFTGPEGGKPLIRPDRWVGYYLSYRPTHPFVLAPVILLIGGIIVLVRRKKGTNPYEEF
jgi:hypothetical protein